MFWWCQSVHVKFSARHAKPRTPPQNRVWALQVVLLGQQSVGKTCLVDRYINSTFETAPKNTIGVAFAAKKVGMQQTRACIAYNQLYLQYSSDFIMLGCSTCMSHR